MEILLKNIGKKYLQEWVFRKVNLELRAGDSLAILGKNGSGKTTLLKLISGAVLPSEGELEFSHQQRAISPEKLYRSLAFAAPYHEMIEELTVSEMVAFYMRFKTLKDGSTPQSLLSSASLVSAADKKIKACSSGMKQRLKLALALFSDCPLLLLDEPLTNLDSEGIAWFQTEIARRSGEQIVVVCSNHIKEEYSFCQRHFKMEEAKIFGEDGIF